MKEGLILYAKLNYQAHFNLLDKYILQLPELMSSKLYSYRFWKDRQRYLLGRLLIIYGFEFYRLNVNPLVNLEYNEFGKPYVKGGVHFNISHSGEYVFCAIDRIQQIGIDVEEVLNVDTTSYTSLLSTDENLFIEKSFNSERSFYEVWTKKEAVIKLLGKGLGTMMSFSVLSNPVIIDSNDLWVNKVPVNSEMDYCCFFASFNQATSISSKEIRF